MTVVSDIESLGILSLRSDAAFKTGLHLIRVFGRIERLTVNWLNSNITSSRSIVLVKSFKLPLQPLIRKHYRAFFRTAYRAGGSDVVTLLPSSIIVFTAKANSRIIVKADLAAERLTSRVERDLKQEWARSIGRKVDRPMLFYQTGKVFADVTGQPRPEGL